MNYSYPPLLTQFRGIDVPRNLFGKHISSLDDGTPRGYDPSMRSIGKLLQVAGLVILPFACLMELTGGLGRSSGLATMLILMVFGAAAFALGRVVEAYSGGS